MADSKRAFFRVLAALFVGVALFLALPPALSMAGLTDGSVADCSSPIADGSAPIADDSAPVADDSAPVADGSAPVADDSAPVADDSAPFATPEWTWLNPVVPDPCNPTVTWPPWWCGTIPISDASAPVAEDSPPVADVWPPSTTMPCAMPSTVPVATSIGAVNTDWLSNTATKLRPLDSASPQPAAPDSEAPAEIQSAIGPAANAPQTRHAAIVKSSSSSGSLPVTGAALTRLLLGGLAFLAAGVSLVAARPRN